MKTDTDMKPAEMRTALGELGFSLEILFGPFGKVDEEKWPHIEYGTRLLFKEREILQCPYRLGIGHVKLNKPQGMSFSPHALRGDEENLFFTWQRKPHADFIDKALQARVAAKLAIAQKVKPELEDVLHSLLMDGEASEMGFDEWCGSFGYDSDSRKAESIYRLCEDTGRKLRNVPREVLEKAREITATL